VTTTVSSVDVTTLQFNNVSSIIFPPIDPLKQWGTALYGLIEIQCSENVRFICSDLGGKMTIMDMPLSICFGVIWQPTSKIHNKFILCQNNKISITLFISHICLCLEKRI